MILHLISGTFQQQQEFDLTLELDTRDGSVVVASGGGGCLISNNKQQSTIAGEVWNTLHSKNLPLF